MMRIFITLVLTTAFLSCNSKNEMAINQEQKYIPDDKELYENIVLMDKEYFDAYNSCDLEKQASLYADDIEFFHDKGGLTTSKEELINSLEKYICGKVTRELVEGSIEVYPIKDYGAVQIGLHKFHNNQEPDAPSRPGKFITMWQHKNDSWKITKVISLH